jgi:hypothetical protein
MTSDPGDLVFDPMHPAEGVGSGFVCKTVPQFTLKSIDGLRPEHPRD